jgi:hypothetical protein
MQINEIIKKDPTLKEYVDELCVKYKINLWNSLFFIIHILKLECQ